MSYVSADEARELQGEVGRGWGVKFREATDEQVRKLGDILEGRVPSDFGLAPMVAEPIPGKFYMRPDGMYVMTISPQQAFDLGEEFKLIAVDEVEEIEDPVWTDV